MQENVSSVQYRYNFLKYRFVCLALSVIIFAVGVASYIARGGFSYHIDFTGGVELKVSFEKSLSVSDIRKSISANGWSDAVIQEVRSGKNSFLIRVGTQDEKLEDKMKTGFAKSFPGNKVSVDNIEWVGAEVGKDTKWNAFKAVMLSLLILLLYIAIRSEFSFGVGAALALVHDVLMVLVFLLLCNEPVSVHVLASVLAVLGYSLNDTIVIYSKIRENFKKLPGASDFDVVNLSINQTLKRTILTSVSTFLSVLAILALGGEALRGLSLVLLLGIVVGTYSSIYIASACMLAVKGSKKA